ncbi:MAG TPA: PKD domain-containing protein, partial [Segetibacter sp.]
MHLIFAASLYSQTHTPKSVVVNSNSQGYYEYLPVNYATSGKKYPLLVYCGGASTLGNGTASDLNKLLAEGVPYYINNKQFPATLTTNGEQTSYIVISPQFVNKPTPTDVEDVINYIINHDYRVDQSRVYLTGFSVGGDATWKYPNTSLSRSKRLAALVPVAGYNYPYVDSGAKYMAAANLPVWALHSNDDSPAPAYWSQNFVNKINSYNPPIAAKITRFSGVSHDQTKLYVYNPSFRDGGYNIYEWMLLYRRNYPPVANAGADQSIVLPENSVAIDGSSSYDPENSALTFSWTKVSGPSKYTINAPTNASTAITNLVAGIYNFELFVTDNNGLTAKDTVKITVVNPLDNKLPHANAGNDMTISLPQNSVALDGSNSSDTDGVIENFSWTKIAGPSDFIITNSSSATATATNLKKGTYLFKLTVTDNEGGTANDTVEVMVLNPFPNTPPVANAGMDKAITLPTNSVSLDGSASSDADGVITNFLWNQIAGPGTATINNPSASQINISNLQVGIYKFALTVTDDSTATTKDTVLVTVNPAPTIIIKYIKVNLYGGTNPYTTDGWNNWNVSGTDNITSGIYSYSDGTSSGVNALLSYSQGVSDNSATYGGTVCPTQVLRYTSYSTATTRTLTIKGLNSSKYDLELYASRANTGNSTQFSINGVNKTVLTDYNKTEKVVFTDLIPSNGQLVVSINKLNTFTYLNGFILSEKSLSQSSNNRPTANAGTDIAITLPVDSVQLNGSKSSDADGNIVSYQWNKISGPTLFTIQNKNSAVTTVNGLAAGKYEFELLVTDNNNGVGKDTVAVIVNPGSQSPVANAGSDQIIHLPVNEAQLNGTASTDADGTITSFEWTKISGPTSFSIDNNQSASPSISNLENGLYAIELKVIDNDGQSAKDTLMVTVNRLPVANAGSDVYLTLPINSTTLNGSASSD